VLGGGQVAPQVFNGGAELNEDVVGQGALVVPERQGVEGVRERVQRPRLPLLRQVISPQLGRPPQGLNEARVEALVVHPAPAHHAGQAIAEVVGSKNQTGLGLCREHGIVWGRMVAIGQITLANTYDGPGVAVVIEIKELHRHSACGCLPNNA
jgi:hypothetical protein